MASIEARAVLLNTSLNRLIEAMPKIAKVTGVDPVAIPTHSRDPQLLMAQQLEALANWAESLLAHFTTPEFEIVDALDGKEDDTEEIAPKSDPRKKGKR